MMRYANGFSSVCKEVSTGMQFQTQRQPNEHPPCACLRQVTASKELYPEHMMGLHLNRAGLSLKILDGFHGALARADENSSVPTITYIDPFAKASVVQLELRVPELRLRGRAGVCVGGWAGRGVLLAADADTFSPRGS